MNSIFRPNARTGANILDQGRIARRWVLPALAVFAAFVAVPASAKMETKGGGIAVGGNRRADLFEARDIPVDATADTVTDAREQAFTEGRIAALRIVLGQIAAKEDLERLTRPSSVQIVEMVRDFSVANERNSAVRYLADLTVRFNAEAVRDLLRAAEILFTEVVSRPLVLLPLYSENEVAPPILWEEGNPWWEAFAKVESVPGLVPLILPAGDLEDAQLTVSQITQRDKPALEALAARYGAGGVVVAWAVGGTPGVAPLRIALTEFRGLAAPGDLSLRAAVTGRESREDMFENAVVAVANAVSDIWKRHSSVTKHEPVQVTVLAFLTGLKDWLRIKDGLRYLPLASDVELQAMTRDRAQATFRYGGDPLILGQAFAQQGLIAVQDGGAWMLRLPGQDAATQ